MILFKGCSTLVHCLNTISKLYWIVLLPSLQLAPIMLTYKELKQLNHEGKLFDYITSPKILDLAYNQTQKGSPKHKRPAVRFRMDEAANLKEISEAVKHQSWKPKGYYKFEIHDPKHRIIFAPAYEDKIVHHLLYQVLREFYEPKFIYDSFSCIRNKGNQRAVARLQQHYKNASKSYEEVHLVKIDIKKFFHTIPREILKQVYAQDIKCVRTLNLLYTIIDSSPGEIGLPLGCVTSQLSANVIMNVFDQFAKRVLKVKYYLRYADDIFMLLPTKQESDFVLRESKKFIQENLGMDFAEGKCFTTRLKSTQSKPKALVGLGYKIYPDFILMKSFNKRRVIRSLQKYRCKPCAANRNSLIAYNSYLRGCNSYNFRKQHFKEIDIHDIFFRQQV